MSVVVTGFSNENACSRTFLKAGSTADILIDQAHKFQNNYFQGHLRKAATVLPKHIVQDHAMKYVHDSILQEALSLKQCIDLPLQFPKFHLVRCFTLSFYDTGLQTGHQIKEVTD